MRLEQAYRGGYEGRPGWWLHLTYDADGVERLKATIPARERTWDEDKKRWWVSDAAVEAALTVVPALEAFEPEFVLVSCGFDAGAFDIFCPKTSRWPDEVWICPKNKGKFFGQITDEEIKVFVGKLLPQRKNVF